LNNYGDGLNPADSIYIERAEKVLAEYGMFEEDFDDLGAGKTYEMVATAMESKRLGLCNGTCTRRRGL
jgi:hypothetical protein